jgi:hypothetical protein
MTRLPTFDPQRPDETRQQYGLRALAFVLATNVTATLDDDALALADHVYPIAIAAHDILPIAVDRLSAARLAILASLKARKALDREQTPDSPTAVPSARQETPDGGTKVPTHPTPTPQPPPPFALVPDYVADPF